MDIVLNSTILIFLGLLNDISNVFEMSKKINGIELK